ncbi:MAG: CRISPR-associated endonuclease Cas2 [Leptospiraceae bacterium]|nr:CRISPR-associated endonuclease Cas2 [Leptospiraceae bacterium]MDW8305811.1 CRISPR-associated endonuclease Cas2 [Leptospiraceae bacterium]
MLVLVCYDVNTETAAGRRRLRQVAKKCESYGQRVQKSVFECLIEPEMYLKLEHDLVQIMDQSVDSLRIYFLNEEMRRKTRVFGISRVIDPEAPIVL